MEESKSKFDQEKLLLENRIQDLEGSKTAEAEIASQSFDKLNNEKIEVEEKLHETLAQKAESDEQYKSVSDSLELLKSEKQELIENIQNLKSERDELQNKFEKSSEELNTLNEKFQGCQMEIETLSAKTAEQYESIKVIDNSKESLFTFTLFSHMIIIFLISFSMSFVYNFKF
jgi:uncharacterized coiled-coil DUF342 family protein